MFRKFCCNNKNPDGVDAVTVTVTDTDDIDSTADGDDDVTDAAFLRSDNKKMQLRKNLSILVSHKNFKFANKIFHDFLSFKLWKVTAALFVTWYTNSSKL